MANFRDEVKITDKYFACILRGIKEAKRLGYVKKNISDKEIISQIKVAQGSGAFKIPWFTCLDFFRNFYASYAETPINALWRGITYRFFGEEASLLIGTNISKEMWDDYFKHGFSHNFVRSQEEVEKVREMFLKV